MNDTMRKQGRSKEGGERDAVWGWSGMCREAKRVRESQEDEGEGKEERAK